MSIFSKGVCPLLQDSFEEKHIIMHFCTFCDNNDDFDDDTDAVHDDSDDFDDDTDACYDDNDDFDDDTDAVHDDNDDFDDGF